MSWTYGKWDTQRKNHSTTISLQPFVVVTISINIAWFTRIGGHPRVLWIHFLIPSGSHSIWKISSPYEYVSKLGARFIDFLWTWTIANQQMTWNFMKTISFLSILESPKKSYLKTAISFPISGANVGRYQPKYGILSTSSRHRYGTFNGLSTLGW